MSLCELFPLGISIKIAGKTSPSVCPVHTKISHFSGQSSVTKKGCQSSFSFEFLQVREEKKEVDTQKREGGGRQKRESPRAS